MTQPVYLTPEGHQKLKDELHWARTKGRAAVAAAIAEAREKGDLSENAEYDAAKEAQGHHEARIAQLEEMISRARVVDEKEVDTSTVRILSQVKLRNLKVNKEMPYTLVAPAEANVAAGKISVDSPIGKGLLGKKVGDTVEIQIPAGKVALEILDITR